MKIITALNERSFGSLKTSGRLGMAREDEDNVNVYRQKTILLANQQSIVSEAFDASISLQFVFKMLSYRHFL